MRCLGVDYGDKRVGIAISDPGGRIAFPKATLFNNQRLIRNLKDLIEEEKISKIVVGLPLASDRSETEQSRKTRAFAENLKKTVNIPLDFENEILTTSLAKQSGVEKKLVDQSSAALILQAYLDKRLKTKG